MDKTSSEDVAQTNSNSKQKRDLNIRIIRTHVRGYKILPGQAEGFPAPLCQPQSCDRLCWLAFAAVLP